MTPADYKHYKWTQELEAAEGNISEAAKTIPSEQEVILSDSIFEAISKRAWTDILLQVIPSSLISVLQTNLCPNQ